MMSIHCNTKSLYNVYIHFSVQSNYMICNSVFYYMRILSASAIHGGAIRCPVWNTSPTDDFIIHVRGDATLTIGPYGSAGPCIINYAPPQINVVVMTLVILV